MDHFSTAEERKARWYSKVTPRFLPVVPAKERHDLLSETKESCVSVPFAWLLKIDDLSINNILQTCLRKDGFVVVSGVLNDAECQAVLECAWDWVEAASRAEKNLQANVTGKEAKGVIDRQDLRSLRSGIFPTSLEGGILPFYGSGHSKAAWTARSYPAIRTVYRALFGSDDLISSLDGIVIWHSDQILADSGWFHVDQNPRKKPECCSYQGLINLLPVTPATGGNVLVRGSHHLFPAHYLNHPDPNCKNFYNTRLDELNGDDWMEIDSNDHVAINPERVISLMMKPGDILLWDSRTVHCSQPPSASTTFHLDPPKLVRAATLVTMMPTRGTSREVLQQRKDAVAQQRTLSHWANQVAPLGAECEEQAQLENKRVNFIREYQAAENKVILCDWGDLNPYQQSLVIGRYDPIHT